MLTFFRVPSSQSSESGNSEHEKPNGTAFGDSACYDGGPGRMEEAMLRRRGREEGSMNEKICISSGGNRA